MKCKCMDTDNSIATCSVDDENLCRIQVVKKRSIRADEKTGYNTGGGRLPTLVTSVNRRKRAKHIVKRSTPTFTEANNTCHQALQNCLNFVTQQTDDLVNKTEINELCALDTMQRHTVEWGWIYCTVMNLFLNYTTVQNRTLAQQSPATVSTIRGNICPASCGGHGTCSPINGKGVCTCTAPFQPPDCIVNGSVPVEIEPPASVTIDVPDAVKLICIPVQSSQGLSQSATCRVVILIVRDVSGLADSPSTFIVNIFYIDYNNAQCCVNKTQSASRRRRSTSSGTNLGNQYSVAVSNNGQNYSDPVTVYSVDTTCLNITTHANGSFTATVQAGYCVIDGTCYTNGTNNTANTCELCITNEDVYAWTNDNNTASCLTTPSNVDDDDGLEGHIIAIIVIGSLLGVGGVAAAGAFVYLKYGTKPVKPIMSKPSHGLFDGPGKEKFNLRKSPTLNQTGDMWYEPQGDPDVPEPRAMTATSIQRMGSSLQPNHELTPVL